MKTNRTARRIVKARTLATWIAIALFGVVEYYGLDSYFRHSAHQSRGADQMEQLTGAGYNLGTLIDLAQN